MIPTLIVLLVVVVALACFAGDRWARLLQARREAVNTEQWRKSTLRAWQLRERIEAMREAKRDKRTKPIKFSDALVNLVKKDEMALVNLLGYPDFKQLVSGRYDVTLRPVVEKKAKPKKGKK